MSQRGPARAFSSREGATEVVSWGASSSRGPDTNLCSSFPFPYGVRPAGSESERRIQESEEAGSPEPGYSNCLASGEQWREVTWAWVQVEPRWLTCKGEVLIRDAASPRRGLMGS